MSDKLTNAFCVLIAAATFAFIGYDAAAHHGSTHSGTQANTVITKGNSK
jgi:hypothetical protein